MAGPNLIRDKVCPFCNSKLDGDAIRIIRSSQVAMVQCTVCGPYKITGEGIDAVERWSLPDESRLAMAFAVRRMTDRAEPPFITSDVLSSLRDTSSLPAPERLLDEAVLWFGRCSRRVGQTFRISYEEYRTALGTVDPQAFEFVADWMIRSGFFQGFKPAAQSSGPIPITNCRLTPAGWSRYGELSQSHARSRQAFMAMRYGDGELDILVADHFAPEVRKAGFELRRLDQGQPAGLIDDQLRVMIRTSRFMVCDLTHGNRGAYWEAGFAEGLGRPVIYTCRNDVFDDRQHENHPHFDTNHMVTVIWDPTDPPNAARRLKDTIRATLPSEAQLTD